MANKKTILSPKDPVSNNSYGERIANELKIQGKTQGWLSEMLGKHRQYIHRLVKMNKASSHADKIAEVLDVNPDWLKTGIGEKYIYKKVKSTPIKIYSLLKLKEIQSLAELSPTKELDTHNQDIDFGIIMDDLTILSSYFPEFSVLLFQNIIDYQANITNSKTKKYLLIHKKNENIISFCQILPSNTWEETLCKPLENYPDKPTYKLLDCDILGLLKSTYIEF